MKEYALWGVPPGETEETLLKTEIKSTEALEYWQEFVQEKGCSKVRVQTIDLSENYDPAAEISRAAGQS